jgi:hypothetical protein
MKFFGESYGGTYAEGTVYLSNRGAISGFSLGYVESAFHHEYSSILYLKAEKRFPKEAWIKCADPDTPYREGGIEALKSGTAKTKYNKELHAKGYLAEYATASMEEDVNMMSEALFSGAKKFWKAVDDFPRLKRKLDLLIAFYKAWDPMFTETYFRSLARTRWA